MPAAFGRRTPLKVESGYYALFGVDYHPGANHRPGGAGRGIT